MTDMYPDLQIFCTCTLICATRACMIVLYSNQQAAVMIISFSSIFAAPFAELHSLEDHILSTSCNSYALIS